MKDRDADPARFVPSADVIKAKLAATEKMAAKLRVLLKAAERLERLNRDESEAASAANRPLRSGR